MQNISPKTLFIGQQTHYLATCESTNSVAQVLLCKNEAMEGTVVVTSNQTQGRGQRGNSWEAEPGQNITLSVVLSPRFLAVGQQFYLNMAISLAVLDFGKTYLPGLLTLKWPNDLFYGDKKWGGILLENLVNGTSLQHTVAGIGLNINQTHFGSPHAVSLSQVTGQWYELPVLISHLLENIEKRYLELRQLRLERLRHDYLQHLYRYQQLSRFAVKGQEVTGQILGVDESGRLAVAIAGRVAYFVSKEIVYLP